MDVGRFLDISEGKFPQKPALVSHGRRYTYAQLKDRVRRLMSGLTNLGVKKGDRVAALMWNRSELVELYLASAKLGAVFAPLNYRLKAPELIYVINDSTPRVLVTDEICLGLLEEATPHVTGIKHLFLTDGNTPNGFKGYEEFLNSHDPFSGNPIVKEDDPCQLLYTSGTTGRPKGVVLSHGNVVWNTINMLHVRHDRPEDVALIVGPLFHAAALNSHLTSRLALGATSIIMGKFDSTRLMEMVRTEGITVVPGTPSMFIMLMEHCSPGQCDTSSVTTLTTGSDKTPDHVKRAMMELFPNSKGIFDIYGCTECGPCVTSLDSKEYFTKKDSVGPPLPFLEVKLLDDDGREVPQGEAGEIVVRGPNVMMGYFGQEEETAKVLKDDWLHTGDLAKADEDGYLYIVDRKKDIIISGGENVSAREVEEVIYSHPSVLKVAAFGLTDPKWVEKVCVALVLREGQTLTKEELISYLKKRMAGYKVPKEIFFSDQLPESGTGKVQKNVLKEKYSRGRG